MPRNGNCSGPMVRAVTRATGYVTPESLLRERTQIFQHHLPRLDVVSFPHCVAGLRWSNVADNASSQKNPAPAPRGCRKWLRYYAHVDHLLTNIGFNHRIAL